MAASVNDSNGDDMRILHYYDKKDDMVSQHVKMLTTHMGLSAENHQATEYDQARTLLQGSQYDVLHVHGCWRNSSHRVITQALRKGTRLVLTPHGQLEPWVQKEHFWQEKLPKRLLYQRSMVQKAYAVIIQGRMEQECMDRLGWNTRTVIIRNAVLTNSISAKDMATETFQLYRKVMDSNTLQLMPETTKTLLRQLLAAGITGDRRWLEQDGEWTNSPTPCSQEEWRMLLCYAEQENLTETIQRGIRVMGLDAPELNTAEIDCFLPDGYQKTESIGQAIGNQFPTENERLLATFKQLRKWDASRQLSIRHLVELNRELRQHPCQEADLAEALKERRLWRLASRLMLLMHDLTGLTEGFMPIVPTNDRIARRMRKQIDNHLTI